MFKVHVFAAYSYLSKESNQPGYGDVGKPNKREIPPGISRIWWVPDGI